LGKYKWVPKYEMGHVTQAKPLSDEILIRRQMSLTCSTVGLQNLQCVASSAQKL